MAEGLLLEARLRARLLVRAVSSSLAKLILKTTDEFCAYCQSSNIFVNKRGFHFQAQNIFTRAHVTIYGHV